MLRRWREAGVDRATTTVTRFEQMDDGIIRVESRVANDDTGFGLDFRFKDPRLQEFLDLKAKIDAGQVFRSMQSERLGI